MKERLKRFITALVSAAMLSAFVTSAYAETATETESGISGGSATLSYNSETGTYDLTDEDGNIIDSAETQETEIAVTDETIDNTEAAVTTAPASAVATTTTVTAATTSVTAATVTAKVTAVAPYVARYRADAEREGKLYTYPTTTKVTTKKTTTTTKKTTTTTTTTTTTKSVYKGIDVSRHQGTINWTKVKAAGIDFVMIRAGYGMEYSQVDSMFHTNIKAAQAAGIECGVYWYSYAVNTSEARKEAEVCYNTIKGYKLSYPVAFDIEDPSQVDLTATTISNIINVFSTYLEVKKYYVSLYSYASFLKTKVTSSVRSSYDIWVAHTGVSKPSYSGAYGMWQYSHTGSVNGVTGNVDLNYGYKNYPAIIKGYKLNGY